MRRGGRMGLREGSFSRVVLFDLWEWGRARDDACLVQLMR